MVVSLEDRIDLEFRMDRLAVHCDNVKLTATSVIAETGSPLSRRGLYLH